jgi:hypothetical protein
MAKDKKSVYGYSVRDDADPTLADQSGDKFDTQALRRGAATLVTTPQPDRKAMRYLGTNEDEPDFDVTKAGAGRGKVNPKQGKDYAKGGKVSSASSRADGCCVKGKTKGRMV